MREVFDAAIGVAPPTRIDVDATIVRQRRLLVLRPAGVVLAAFVVVAAIIVGGNSLAGSAHRGAPPPMTGPGSASAAPGRSTEPPEQVLRRQSAALDELLHAALPGVTIADQRTRGAHLDVIPSKDYPGYLDGDAHMAIAVLTSAAGTGDLTFSAEARPGTGSSPLPSETAPEPGSCAQWRAVFKPEGSGYRNPECTDSTGPGGETVLALSVRNEALIMYLVLVWRPYSLVSVSIRNCWNGWDSTQAPTGFLPQPQLTLDQLTAVALDPRLAM